MNPFEVDLGWNLKSPLDFVSTTKLPNEIVSEFKKRLKAHWMTPSLHMNWQNLIKAQDLALNTGFIPINQAIKYDLTKGYVKINIPNLNSLINCLLKYLVLSLYWSYWERIL